MSNATQKQHEPKFAPGSRVAKRAEPRSGRVQGVTYDRKAEAFRYLVKWDFGPTTSHLENDLAHEPLPEKYP